MPKSTPDTKYSQRELALMLKEVHFWKPVWAFVVDLINEILERENELSDSQEEWLRHYFYRYREQIKDIIVYEKRGPDEVYEMYDDVRVAVEEAIKECEPYKDIEHD